MPDAPAATPAPDPAPPAPAAAATPAAPVAAEPTSAQVTQAAKTLAERRADRKAALAKPATGDKPTETAADKPPEAKPGDKPPEKPAEAKPEADEQGKELQALIAHQRKLRAKETELQAKEARFKDFEAVVPEVQRARALVEKGDRIGALKAMFGDEFAKDIMWDLLKDAPEDAAAGEVDIDKLVETKLEARERARREDEERRRTEETQGQAARLAKVDEYVREPGFAAAVAKIPTLHNPKPELIEAFAGFVAGCGQDVAASPAKYKAITKLGVSSLRVVQKAEELRAKNGAAPTREAVLQGLEDELTGVVRELLGAPAPAAPPSVTVDSSWRQEVGRPAPDEAPPKDLDEIRARRKAALLKAAKGAG